MFRNIVLCLLLAIWCRAEQAPAADGGSHPSTAARSSGDYQLLPSDLLQVQVFQEEDLTREVRVSQDSSITLPLIGTLNVKGRTLRQLEEMVRDLLNKDYLVNPHVTIVVKEYAQRTVNVQGQVGQPGAIVFPQERGLTLLGAITRAGGFTRLSDKSRVILTRVKPDGSVETFKINANELIEGKSSESWPLMEEDSIFIPERIL